MQDNRDLMRRLPWVILIAGSATVLLAFGLRASLGLYLKPMSIDLGWERGVFALAMASQNLLWGVFQPFAAAISEKWGTGRVVAGGGVLYGIGLVIMAVSSASEPGLFHLGAGFFIGLAQSASALGVVLGAVGRAMPPERRTFGLGIVTAAGAAGQFTVVPLGQELLEAFGWSQSLFMLAAMTAMIVACAPLLRNNAETATQTGPQLSLGQSLNLARRHKGFWLLTIGFMVCGFQISFMAVHLPAYITDLGFSADLGAWSLAVIGLFNVVGSYAAGLLGDRKRKTHLLSYLYIARSILVTAFVLLPPSPASVIVFSAVMGLLWLSTVPLTSGIVAQIFGPRYMATLFGIVFFTHQVGSFVGVYFGGVIYDQTGSYDPIWWASVIFGLIAAVMHWPIDDRSLQTAAASPAPAE
ncbi:MAG: MFS transporter [Magnetospiraceae bacterium]